MYTEVVIGEFVVFDTKALAIAIVPAVTLEITVDAAVPCLLYTSPSPRD